MLLLFLKIKMNSTQLYAHEKYKNEWLGKRVQENSYFGYQCVASVKHYIKAIFGEQLGVFGGSALSGWKDNAGTFRDYTRVINDYGDLNNVPNKGDIIFFNDIFGVYGHVAIVDSSDGYTVTVIEQNGENGSGKGINGDEIRLAKYGFKGVSGWFQHKDNEDFIQTPEIQVPVCNDKYDEIRKYINLINEILDGVDHVEDGFEYQHLVAEFGTKSLPHKNGVFSFRFFNDHPVWEGFIEQIFFNNAFTHLEDLLTGYRFERQQDNLGATIEVVFTQNGDSLMPVKSDGTPYEFKSRALAFAFSPDSSRYSGKMYVNTAADIKISGGVEANKAIKIFAHEGSHLLGFGHSDDEDSTLYDTNLRHKPINWTEEDIQMADRKYPPRR